MNTIYFREIYRKQIVGVFFPPRNSGVDQKLCKVLELCKALYFQNEPADLQVGTQNLIFLPLPKTFSGFAGNKALMKRV